MNASNWMLISAALLALLLLLVIGAVIYGLRRWKQDTRVILTQLEVARISPSPAGYDARELEGLPAPVQRYFRQALRDGQPIVTAGSVTHTGTFNMSATAEQWKHFTSTQRVITRRAGFDWHARIMVLPGVPVHVHDAYIAGEGLLRGALFGLVPVVHIAGTPET